jgi:hydrogenase nickel incorporation protein HypA/HybF
MHELSTALSIIDVAAEESRSRGDAKVLAVYLRLGQLSGVEKDVLQSAFDVAREHTVASGAELRIEEVPVMVYCERCGSAQAVASPESICCSGCGTVSPRITQGRELEVVAMELEAAAAK